MTERLKGVYVAFEKDIREDDAECIIQAIRMVRRVASVAPIEAEASDWINRHQVKCELREAFMALWDKTFK